MEIEPNITPFCLDRHTSEGNINRHTNKAKNHHLHLLGIDTSNDFRSNTENNTEMN